MKKINIQTILLFSFGLISLIVLTTGIREIVILNNLREISNSSKKLYNDQAYINENLIMINADHSLVKSVINTQSFSDFESFRYEHENFVRMIKKNSEQIDLDTDEYSDIRELDIIFKESTGIYTDEILKNFVLIFEKKDIVLNIDNYYIENIESHSNISKEQLYKDFKDEILEINDETDILFKEVIANFNVIVQKNKQLISDAEEKLDNRFRRTENIALIFFISIIIISLLILVIMIRSILKPLEKIQQQLDIITQGELPDDIHISTAEEISRMAVSINKLISGLKRGADFSMEIGDGNFDSDYKPLSDNDVLGNSLLTLRDNLQTAEAEEEKRKTEDAQRNRTNEGLTMFSEILRQQTGNISDLADDIISSLVKFMKANQGALFFLNEEDKKNIHYELLGAYAYNRKKFLSKQIKPGEGLVGSVAIEKYTVYMTDVPDEYIEIESGVGSANPRSVLIAPLKIDENVLGVIELASFNLFEKYEIEMVEKIAESIASSLANARINMQTAKLLEQSKDQEKLVLEQEHELTQTFKEIKELTKMNGELTKELERLKKKVKE